MLHPSKPSSVAAGVFFAALYNQAILLRGMVLYDTEFTAKLVSRYLISQSRFLRISRSGTSFRIVVHTLFWRHLQTGVAFYEPYHGEKILRRRSHGKTFRGTLTEDNLLHALRWVRAYGRAAKQFDICFAINPENVRLLMRRIEILVADAR